MKPSTSLSEKKVFFNTRSLIGNVPIKEADISVEDIALSKSNCN